MEETVLRVENISKNFGMTQALKDVNFSIRKGTIHSLLGRNGAGKSGVPASHVHDAAGGDPVPACRIWLYGL